MAEKKNNSEPIAINSIGINQHGYKEYECPGCKKHFYWSPTWKEFHCSCDKELLPS